MLKTLLQIKKLQPQRNDLFSRALPQINANVDFNHYINLQKTILENNPGTRGYDSTQAIGKVIPTQFFLPNQFLPSITATQIVFDQSYFSSIGASKVLKQISEKNIKKTKIDVAYNVVSAYYGVLVNEKQLAFLESNLLRIDSSYRETKSR